ncbi:hypothetical protein [Neobacillus ginsengisoli]|uniref:Uncharacterized protein n=1 Tax=Neobacillus ginsengisoli TaxID=904295 RepID=A0ABT9XZB0_9BACI|nr:hypothetical protein [Neobacillus ginsengisoli]MDQ0200249.1 hypothetical protein [Neobacillus ginsengisoli]
MQKGNQNSPQEFQNKGNTNEKMNKNIEVDLDNNDIRAESAIINGGGDPNLSPDAGKP